MLYLEDYLEMIENLPMEMRDRFTEMREMDLQVQNAMDSLEDRVKKFFEKCGNTPSLKQDWKDDHFKKIKEDYHRALEDADEKVQLTAQIYDQLERYLRKLDTELQKFKLELEADNAGITEILEKRSLELDNPQNNHTMNHRGEKRKYAQMMSNHVDKRRPDPHSDKMFSSLASDTARESLHHLGSGGGGGSSSTHTRSLAGTNSATNSPAGTMFNSTSTSSSSATPALSYSLGHVGAGSNAAIAAAASRAIGATLEMSQGRRTASLKASYEAMRNADITKELTISRQYSAASGGSAGGGGGGGGGSESTTPTPTSQTSQNSSRKKKTSSRAQQQQQQQAAATAAQSQLAQQLQQQVVVETTPPPTELVGDTVVTDDQSATSAWQVDPNEPRYCICNDVSYGDMVGCDNDDCPIEWFHYGCVGLTAAPRGKWYCPQCTVAMKRRGRK